MTIEQTTVGHLTEFLLTGRPLDIIEMSIGRNQHLMDIPIADLSDSLSMVHAGRLYAIGGISGHVVWMLCTKEVEENKIRFLRETKKLLHKALQEVDYLENYVWIPNQLHYKWLAWMGAEFGEVKGDFQYFRFNKKGE